MTKITLPRFTTLTNETSVVTSLNAAMQALEDQIDLLVSRNGESPNTMTATLDMNGQRIINHPAPVDDTDLVRLIDVAEGVRGPPGEDGAQGPPGSATLSDALDAIAADTASADTFYVWSGPSAGAFCTIAPFALTYLFQTTPGGVRSTLGLGGASILNVGTSASTVAAGDDSRFTALGINPQSGATYTFAATDAGKIVRQTAGGTHTYTINPFGTTPIPVGSVIRLRNVVGSGVLTLNPGSGVTLYVNGGTVSASASLANGAWADLVHEATNIWSVIGPGVS